MPRNSKESVLLGRTVSFDEQLTGLGNELLLLRRIISLDEVLLGRGVESLLLRRLLRLCAGEVRLALVGDLSYVAIIAVDGVRHLLQTPVRKVHVVAAARELVITSLLMAEVVLGRVVLHCPCELVLGIIVFHRVRLRLRLGRLERHRRQLHSCDTRMIYLGLYAVVLHLLWVSTS